MRSISPRTRKIGCDPEARCRSDAETSSIRLKNASILAIAAFPPKVAAIILRGHMSQLLIGAEAPDFELSDVNGQTYRLSEALSRGPVALVFYKSACPTCQFSFPHIQKMFSELGNTAGWTLWGISEDDVDETKEFASHHGLTFDLLIDEYPYPVSAAYGLQFVPLCS
jgi:peroxiredoxin